ncbi:MAG: LysM peptidoglycan-binding domain-containing protein [bacterium]
MRRLVVPILAAVLLVSACGSSPKQAKPQHSKRGRHSDLAVEGEYRRRGNATSEDESLSLEDIIYSSLGHKQGSGVRYGRSYVVEDGKFDIPMTYNDRVQKWIDYFTGSGRRHYERYLSRSGRFIPYMQAVLKKYGMPKDIVYLSMIESGFNTRANSWASAVGPWQFIKSTGALYGLNVDYYVDERRDIEKSTHAAAQHLKDLYDEFGDWYLAFAAYNAGAGKIRNAISRDGSNFWDMADGSYLRQETKDYVPKILAAAMIGHNPEKYGFRGVEYQVPIDYEKVKMSSPTDLEVAAECAGVDPDLVRLLNPELLQDMTPPHIPGYVLKIPRGTRDRFMRKYASLSPSQRMRSIEYVVQRGDSLGEIADKFGVSEKEIAKANPDGVEVRNEKRSEKVKVYTRKGRAKWEKRSFTVARYDVEPGSRLTIPRGRSGRADSSSDDAAAHAAKERFGLDIAKLEGPTEEKGKHKKDKKKEQRKAAAEAEVARRDPLPPPEPEVKPPVRSDDLAVEGDPFAGRGRAAEPAAAKDDLPTVAKNDAPGELRVGGTSDAIEASEKKDSNRATPMGFNNRPEGAAPAPAVAEAPSDAQLQQAVEGIRKSDDLALSPGEKSEPAAAPEAEASAPAKEAKPARAATTYHTVKRGETLASIAAKYGVSTADLKEWNPKALKGGLKSGTKLLLKGDKAMPSVATPKGRPDSAGKPQTPSVYVVKRGDTLSEVAAKYGVTVEQLKAWNGKKVAGGLKSGTKLALRGPEVAEQPVVKVASAPAKPKSGKTLKYKVKRGDNLTTIAKMHDTTPDELQRLNGLKSPKVVPGAILVVRRGK